MRVHDICGAFKRTLVLSVEGEAVSYTHTVDQLASLTGQLSQVAFGKKHMVALTRSGDVFTLGDGSLGQLGHGSTEASSEPQLVKALQGRSIAQVCCGETHCLALSASGDVYTWGQGVDGQLGLGEGSVALVPRYVRALHGSPVKMIAAGGAHSADRKSVV